MIDFKKGDEVWWFEFPDQNLCRVEEIELNHGIFNYRDEKYIRLVHGSISYKDVDLFKSKDIAIDIMINHLNKMRTK